MHLVIVAGASEEDIMVMLQECNNDVNETTSRLIDSKQSASPFRSCGCCQGGQRLRKDVLCRPFQPGARQKGQKEEGEQADLFPANLVLHLVHSDARQCGHLCRGKRRERRMALR